MDNFEQIPTEKGGFFDLEDKYNNKCKHPNHNPPQHLYIPPGKGYRHVCPNCGKVKDIIPPQITL